MGRRRQPLPRPARRHRRQRARPRPPGPRGRGDRPAADARPRLELLRHRSRRSSWPSGCSRLLGQPGHVFFTNSGTEANEAAFKLTRRTGRTKLVAAEGAFHGRTMGALALTSKAAYREPFEPLPGDVTFVPYGDVAALEAAVTDETAAVVLEPIQGEAGVVVPPDGYLAAARRITAEHGALLWLDEVQTGIGRTGDWFAHTRARRRARRGRRWPRGSAAASRSAPASASVRPASCSSPATTAPRSAATRWRRRAAGRPRHHRDRRAARPRPRRPAQPLRDGAGSRPRHRGARRGAAGRARPRRATGAAVAPRGAGRAASSSTTARPRGSGSPRRSCSPTSRSTSSSQAGR